MKLRKNKKSKEVQEAKAINKRAITRKEAIKKTGYIALSAATMMLLISKPDKSQAASSPAAPGSGSGSGSDW